MNNSSTPFYFSDNEFGELLWENGQIVMHEHSTRSKRFPPQDQTATDAITSTSTSTSSIVFSNNRGKNASDFTANGFLATQDEEDMVPWMDEPLRSSPLRHDPFQADFCSEFLDEFAGANPTTSLNFTTAQPTTTGTGTGTGTGTELRKEGEPSSLVNFSLFKPRVRPSICAGEKENKGKRDEHVLASSSTCMLELRNVPPDIPSICDGEKERNGNKRDEPILASSSVCLENSEGFESTDPKHGGKRKIREGEESSSNSEAELEDESGGGKRVTIGRGASVKKSRAAEVHNLSERRRRERINEKMKALQELIPNCSKADKASMLDDAIEYLKTLQLQVQMMSMGSGMYMPPAPVMMLPTMQVMRAPPMPHFSPMGMYQMGMGMGMYPPIPQQFIPGPPAMHGMVAPTLFHPPVPVPAPVGPIRPNKVQEANPAATPDPKAETL